MNSGNIQLVLENYVKQPTQFLGVFPKDRLPPFRPLTCFVANTDPECMPGQHWVAFLVDARRIEYFDSYGESPALYGFNVDASRVLSYPVQALDSDTCGDHCMHYLISRTRGCTLDHLRSRYHPTQLGANDVMIRRYIYKLLKRLKTVPLRNACACNQCCTNRRS